MRLKIVPLVSIVLASIAAHGAEVVILPTLTRPETITIGSERMIITEGPVVSVYDLETRSLLKKFGKSGEGPQEFKIYPVGSEAAVVHSERILINSIGKVSWFTLNGDFINEIKTQFPFARFKPLKEGFVGSGEDVKNKIYYQTIHLYNAGFERGAEIYRRRDWAQEGTGNHVVDAGGLVVRTSGEYTYIADRAADTIAVFDESGKKVRVLRPKFARVPVADRDKALYHEYYRTHPFFKNVYDRYKKYFMFPDFYPGIRDVVADGETVYILTFWREEGRSAFVCLDLKDQSQRRCEVRFADRDIQNPSPYTVFAGKLYQLREDGGGETWELHIIPIQG